MAWQKRIPAWRGKNWCQNKAAPTLHLTYNIVAQNPKKLFRQEKSNRESLKQIIDKKKPTVTGNQDRLLNSLSAITIELYPASQNAQVAYPLGPTSDLFHQTRPFEPKKFIPAHWNKERETVWIKDFKSNEGPNQKLEYEQLQYRWKTTMSQP